MNLLYYTVVSETYLVVMLVGGALTFRFFCLASSSSLRPSTASFLLSSALSLPVLAPPLWTCRRTSTLFPMESSIDESSAPPPEPGKRRDGDASPPAEPGSSVAAARSLAEGDGSLDTRGLDERVAAGLGGRGTGERNGGGATCRGLIVRFAAGLGERAALLGLGSLDGRFVSGDSLARSDSPGGISVGRGGARGISTLAPRAVRPPDRIRPFLP